MRLLRWTCLAAALLGVLLGAGPVKAEFQVCNHSAKTAYVAFGHWNNTIYTTQGWRIAQPGACVITYAGDLEWQWYFVYARTAEDEFGNYEIWSGDVLLCVNWPNGFTILGDELCETGFIKIDTGLSKNFTFNLE